MGKSIERGGRRSNGGSLGADAKSPALRRILAAFQVTESTRDSAAQQPTSDVPSSSLLGQTEHGCTVIRNIAAHVDGTANNKGGLVGDVGAWPNNSGGSSLVAPYCPRRQLVDADARAVVSVHRSILCLGFSNTMACSASHELSTIILLGSKRIVSPTPQLQVRLRLLTSASKKVTL